MTTRRRREPSSKRISKTASSRSFWDKIAERGARIPVKEQDKLPRDFARRFDEYMEGGTEPR